MSCDSGYKTGYKKINKKTLKIKGIKDKKGCMFAAAKKRQLISKVLINILVNAIEEKDFQNFFKKAL